MSTRVNTTLREDIRALATYHVPDATGMVKLDAMENPYELPLALRVELAQRLAHVAVNRYPSPHAKKLHDKIRETFSVPKDSALLLGNGSDELISMIAIACARPQACLLSLAPSFVMYAMSAKLAGLNFVTVNLTDHYTLDRNETLAAIHRHQPGVIYLAYPNNPTGTLYPVSDVEAILAAAPGLVVVDEAYHAFAQASFMTRLPEFPNMLVMRTLSKSGLAGIRLGYMAGHPDWIHEFDKVRPPYNVNLLTQEYALFALEHHDVLEAQAAVLRAERERLYNALRALPGVEVLPSAGNFLLFRTAHAEQVFERLKDRRLLLKYLGVNPSLRDCLRVTVSSPEENAQFLDALKDSL